MNSDGLRSLINSALQSLARGPTSSAQAMGQYLPPSAQSIAVHALMSLSGMLSQSTPLNTTPAATQTNSMESILLLLLALLVVVEDEHQQDPRRRYPKCHIGNNRSRFRPRLL